MRSVAAFLIGLGILIGGVGGWYVVTHEGGGDVDFGWAVVGAYAGVVLALVGAALSVLDHRRNLRK
jgi:hypothetical protein